MKSAAYPASPRNGVLAALGWIVVALAAVIAFSLLLSELHGMREELGATNAKLDGMSARLGETNEQVVRTNRRLDQTNRLLISMSGQLGDTNRELKQTTGALQTTNARLSHMALDMGAMKASLGVMTHRIVHAKLLF